MTRRVLALLCTLAFAGTAFADARADAFDAGAFDCITTGEALAGIGFGEFNPIGAVAACALKVPAVIAANRLSEPDRTTALQAQRAIWDAAAVHNVALLAGASSVGATGLGAMAALVIWQLGADEREFKRLCAVHEQLAGHAMNCIYTSPKGAS